MANQELNLPNKNNQIYLEKNLFYKNALKKQYIEVEHWKIRTEMISNLKKKEIQKLNEQMIEKKNIQNKINRIRIQYCDYIQSLMENHWLLDLENGFKNLTKIKETETSKSTTSVICSQLQNEINTINCLIKGLNLLRSQKEKLIELARQIDKTEHSVPIWKEYILKVEKKMSAL